MALHPDELKKRIKGVMALVMTPFAEDESLDEPALREHLRFMVDNLRGQDAVLVALGSTGEFYAMTDSECKRAAEIIVDEVDRALPVIIGTGRGGTRYTIEMSRHAEEIGADGVLVVNPYYNLVSREGLYRHFALVAEAIDIGVMIYNNPVISKLWIDVELMQRLSRIPNIVADKENTPSVAEFSQMVNTIDPNDMAIVSGPGEILFQFEILHGSKGFFTTLPAFAPGLAIELWELGKQQEFPKLAEFIRRKISPFYTFVSKIAANHGPVPSMLGPKLTSPDLPVYQGVTKAAMNIMGLLGGKTREPMESLTERETAELRLVLKEMGVFDVRG